MVRIVIPVAKVKVREGEEYRVYPHFSRAPYFAMVDVEESGSYSVNLLENPLSKEIDFGRRGRGRLIVEFILGHSPYAVVTTFLGSGAYYRLIENGIKVLKPVRKDVRGIVEDFVRGRLTPLEGPVE